MAVRHHNEVLDLDDEAFAAWRKQKMKELVRAAPGKGRFEQKRHAHDVIRRYAKRRRARIEAAAEET